MVLETRLMRWTAYLLLLHELRVGTVINDILSEDRGGQDSVDFLGVDVFQLAVQDEIVARGSDVYGCFLAEENEGKDIAILMSPY
jgi:hypothetical protein